MSNINVWRKRLAVLIIAVFCVISLIPVAAGVTYAADAPRSRAGAEEFINQNQNQDDSEQFNQSGTGQDSGSNVTSGTGSGTGTTTTGSSSAGGTAGASTTGSGSGSSATTGGSNVGSASGSTGTGTEIKGVGTFNTKDQFLNKIMNKFDKIARESIKHLQHPAFVLWVCLGAIEIATNFSLYEGQIRLSQMISTILKLTFYLFLIIKWDAFCIMIMDFMQSMGKVASGLGTSAGFTGPSEILGLGWKAIGEVVSGISLFSITSPFETILRLFALILLGYGFFRIALEVFMTMVEFCIYMGLSTVFLPFNVCRFTASFGSNVFNGLVGYGARMLIINFLVGLIFKVINIENELLGKGSNQISDTIQMGCIMATLAYLVSKAADMGQALVSGAGPQTSGAGLMNTAKQGPAMAMNKVAGVAAAAGTVAAVANYAMSQKSGLAGALKDLGISDMGGGAGGAASADKKEKENTEKAANQQDNPTAQTPGTNTANSVAGVNGAQGANGVDGAGATPGTPGAGTQGADGTGGTPGTPGTAAPDAGGATSGAGATNTTTGGGSSNSGGSDGDEGHGTDVATGANEGDAKQVDQAANAASEDAGMGETAGGAATPSAGGASTQQTGTGGEGAGSTKPEPPKKEESSKNDEPPKKGTYKPAEGTVGADVANRFGKVGEYVAGIGHSDGVSTGQMLKSVGGAIAGIPGKVASKLPEQERNAIKAMGSNAAEAMSDVASSAGKKVVGVLGKNEKLAAIGGAISSTSAYQHVKEKGVVNSAKDAYSTTKEAYNVAKQTASQVKTTAMKAALSTKTGQAAYVAGSVAKNLIKVGAKLAFGSTIADGYYKGIRRTKDKLNQMDEIKSGKVFTRPVNSDLY